MIKEWGAKHPFPPPLAVGPRAHSMPHVAPSVWIGMGSTIRPPIGIQMLSPRLVGSSSKSHYLRNSIACIIVEPLPDLQPLSSRQYSDKRRGSTPKFISSDDAKR
jgi:hypothetical protein